MKTQMTTRTDDRCRECGGELAFHSYKHVEKVGRYTITDTSGMVWQCLECKTPQLTLDELQAYQLNAAKTVLCEGRHDGEVVRYARKSLGLTQKELGLIIDYKHETISRWETDKEPVPGVAASALVGVLCRAMDGESPEAILASAMAQREPKDGGDELPAMPRRRECA